MVTQNTNTEAIQNTETMESNGSNGPNRPVESISRLYFLLARCFSYPDEGFCEAMKDKRMEDAIKGLIEGLPFEMDSKGIPTPSLPQDEFESVYIDTFDIGMGRPLYESAYTAYRDDMCSRDIYEDLLRFYEHFNVRLNEKERDYPDNLVVELEFMAFLAKKEFDALKLGKDPDPYRLAQLDFLEKHLNKWVHKLDERIQKRLEEPFYRGASAFMVEFIRNHQLYLREMLKS